MKTDRQVPSEAILPMHFTHNTPEHILRKPTQELLMIKQYDGY